MVKAIVGANWGDEGKGKITDLLAEQSDVVIRSILFMGLPPLHRILFLLISLTANRLLELLYYASEMNATSPGASIASNRMDIQRQRCRRSSRSPSLPRMKNEISSLPSCKNPGKVVEYSRADGKNPASARIFCLQEGFAWSKRS